MDPTLPVPIFVHQLGQRSRSRRHLDEDGQPPQQEQPQPDTSSAKGQEILPLFPGYGTHYAYVYVGTPPQRQSVIIDTGTYSSNSNCIYTYITSKYACVYHYHHKHKYLSIYKSIHVCIYLCNHLSIFIVFLSSYLSPARYSGSHYTAFPCTGCSQCGQHTDSYWDLKNSSSATVPTCINNQPCVISQSYTEGSSWKGLHRCYYSLMRTHILGYYVFVYAYIFMYVCMRVIYSICEEGKQLYILACLYICMYRKSQRASTQYKDKS